MVLFWCILLLCDFNHLALVVHSGAFLKTGINAVHHGHNPQVVLFLAKTYTPIFQTPFYALKECSSERVRACA